MASDRHQRSQQYSYDRVGNVTVITDYNNSGQMQLFGYDALNRLTTAAAIGGLDGYYTRTYQYDAIGNLTLGDGGYYYYESVRPHAVITVGNPLSSMTAYYGYDGNGSATFITRTLLSMTYTLTYDPENRVKQVVPSDGPTAIFRYDGDGTRVLGIVGGVTTTYAGTWYEHTASGVSYYYFNGQRVAMRNADGVTYVHRDHLGSAVTTTGVLTQGQRYDAWGETRGTSTVDTPYRYTGQREEDDLLLYFYNARWYDAALGRFIQADSIVPQPHNPQALNRYTYVLNNPLKYVDATGKAATAEGPGIGVPKEEWERRFMAAHDGRAPTEQDWVEYRLSLTHPGTGPGGAWTEQDWTDFGQLKQLLGSLLGQMGQRRTESDIYSLIGLSLSWHPVTREDGRVVWVQDLEWGFDGTLIANDGLRPPNADAITFGDVMVMHSSADQPTMNEEFVHVLQYREVGILYGYYYAQEGFSNWTGNSLEVQAGVVRVWYELHPFLPDVHDLARAGWRCGDGH